MAESCQEIEILTVKEQTEIPFRDIKKAVMGMQQPCLGEYIVRSGAMTGCHLVIGVDSKYRKKFLSHDNVWKVGHINKTKQKIKEIGSSGKFYLFLTQKSLCKNGSERVGSCIEKIQTHYDNIKFNKIYYIDDSNRDRIEVTLNLEIGKLFVEGISNMPNGKCCLSIYETTIPIVEERLFFYVKPDTFFNSDECEDSTELYIGICKKLAEHSISVEEGSNVYKILTAGHSIIDMHTMAKKFNYTDFSHNAEWALLATLQSDTCRIMNHQQILNTFDELLKTDWSYKIPREDSPSSCRLM